MHSRHASLGTLSGAGASRAELERIIAIDRQALQLARTKLVGLSGREYDEEKKVGHLPCYHTTATHMAHRPDTILCPSLATGLSSSSLCYSTMRYLRTSTRTLLCHAHFA